MSRRAVFKDTAAESPAGGVVPGTLAGHRRFTLIACCETCERHIELNNAALAERFGWDAMLDELRRRVTCRRCWRRTDRVLLAPGGRPWGHPRHAQRPSEEVRQ